MEEQAFRRAFSALVGKTPSFKPFPWQTALWKLLSRGDIPARLDLPTGLGKTSVMGLWLIALAGGAPLPRRLIYVVDRRTVVDQSTDFAVGLRNNLPAVRKAVEAGWPAGLSISTLRGGFADNREWLCDPSQVAIVIGTVDMIGSQLLFEGYGVTRRMRSMHAGLLGADTLVLLDEAHLSAPFLRLIEAVAEMRHASDAPAPPFRFMSLSATGAGRGADEAFRLTEDDRKHEEVRRRLTAPKRLRIETVPGAGAADFVKRSLALAEGGTARIVVFHDSRQEAVKIADLLEKKTGAPVERLTGARRGWERDRATRRLAELGFLEGVEVSRETPVFLVATSAGEVGIDLDADHMVCDLVPWERMVQRLGRVNRRGRGKAEVVVLDPEPDPKRRDDAPRLDATRELLAALPPDEVGDAFQAGPGAIETLKESRAPEELEAASTAPPLHPPLSLATVEAWSLTSLRQHPGRPQVAPWLRGWVEDDPQTTLAWRRWLPARRAGDGPATLAPDSGGFFEDAPIHVSERLETLTAEALDWLLIRAAALVKGTEDAEVTDGDLAYSDLAAVLLDPAGEPVSLGGWTMTVRSLAALSGPTAKLSTMAKRRKSALRSAMIGATLVVDARLGGLAEGLLDANATGSAASADGGGTTDGELWRARARDPADPAAGPLIGFRIEPARVEAGALVAPALPVAEAGKWREARLFPTRLDLEGEALAGLAVFRWKGATGSENSRSRAGKPQTLDDHTRMVVEEAERLGVALALPAEVREALVVAAQFHDRGKATPVWQRAMRAPPGGPWAKTKGGDPKKLHGYRHEFGSLLEAEKELRPGETRDLILHLIAAHHGNARPIVSPANCDASAPSALEATAADAAMRFARLQRRYGPWGLAWLEALLRAADQRASARWEEQSHG